MSNILRVENLDSSTTAQDVAQLFSSVGEVRGAQLFPDRNGSALCMVEMTSEIQARRAVVALDEREYRGQVLGVSMADQRSAELPAPAPAESNGGSIDMNTGPARGSFGDRSGSGPRGALFYIDH